MSLTQLSQHLFIAGYEDPTQCFQRYGQPLSQLCYAHVETGPDGAQFVLWSKIQELYDREGKVKFVVDDNDLVPLAVGPDMQIIVPWRIQAFLDKILQVALNDEQPGCLDLKTPADIHPIATTDYNAESVKAIGCRLNLVFLVLAHRVHDSGHKAVHCNVLVTFTRFATPRCYCSEVKKHNGGFFR
ncbi:hypothetical protein BGZ89_009160 [Linnemannia elongata]|nr:hypothetical protein BGZ89_009160 [Linnemannia elongata]